MGPTRRPGWSAPDGRRTRGGDFLGISVFGHDRSRRCPRPASSPARAAAAVVARPRRYRGRRDDPQPGAAMELSGGQLGPGRPVGQQRESVGAGDAGRAWTQTRCAGRGEGRCPTLARCQRRQRPRPVCPVHPVLSAAFRRCSSPAVPPTRCCTPHSGAHRPNWCSTPRSPRTPPCAQCGQPSKVPSGRAKPSWWSPTATAPTSSRRTDTSACYNSRAT